MKFKLDENLGSGKCLGVFMRAATGLREIADTQCGFKFFHGDVARRLFALQQIDGYMYDEPNGYVYVRLRLTV